MTDMTLSADSSAAELALELNIAAGDFSQTVLDDALVDDNTDTADRALAVAQHLRDLAAAIEQIYLTQRSIQPSQTELECRDIFLAHA